MRSLRQFVLFGGLLTALAPGLAGEELPLTVREAVVRALQADPSVAAAAELAGAAGSALASRRLDRLPSLALAAAYARLNEVDPIVIPATTAVPPANAFGVGAELRQPLFSGGRLSEQVRGATLEAQAARSDAGAARLDLRLQVVRTYWQLHRHTAAVAALQERRDQVLELSKELESRVAQGLATREELLRLQSLSADTELRLARSRSARELAALELALLTGLAPEVTVIPVSALPLDLPALPAKEALWIQAEVGHPRLDSALLRVETARSAERILRAGLFPNLALTASYGYQSPDSRVFPPEEGLRPYWRVGANLGFDLLSPLRIPVLVREAASRRQAASYRAAALQEQLFLAISRAYAEALLAEQEVQAADTAGRYAEELHRAAQDRYDQGAALRSVLLDAQAIVLEAELRLIDARVNRVVSRAALAAAAGTLASVWAAGSGFSGELP